MEENIDIDRLRHSAAHVLAMAAQRLFPDTKIGVGPVTDDGYYYDFEFPHQITVEDLRLLEAEMNDIILADLPFTQIVVSKEEGFDILLKRGQIFKAELLREIPAAEVSFYRTGEEFIDLCRGPHLDSTSQIGAIKLLSLTDTFWQGDSSRPAMQRVMGTAFPDKESLNEYLTKKDQIASRDFRQLAKHLQLNLGGESNVTYTPGGTMAFQQIREVITRSYKEQEFQEVLAPPVINLGQMQSGVNSYYSHKNRSYKELPISIYTFNRNELADAHQIAEHDYRSISTLVCKTFFSINEKYNQLQHTIHAAVNALESLRLDYTANLHVGDLEDEYLAQISELLQRKGVPQKHIVDPETNGVYIEFCGKDSLDRNWVFARCHFQESEFKYVSRLGDMENVFTFSSEWIVENLLAFFIEDQEGLLPIWLAPTQVRIIPISEEHYDFAEKAEKSLVEAGFRCEVDARSETMQARIRHAELLRIPVIAIIGEKEQSSNAVSLRLRQEKEVGMVALDSLVETIVELYS
ncbi:hypothetical protein KC640_02905 [Candidatus Dojkabacteria bacterium]|uniref:Threonyl/alanyl tRNA synthetase SAD domain-containing protein n=1 Tax=Candidatus Dojkabacteria bacterium TaxID=2099670 RepID=A0A955KZQ8_9BACT|nr:hypothetical protein [Candidatus Dojkabacteria bacterium]